jgi:hypothetical protein
MTTKHSHESNFGRKVDGCPRCIELSNGAEAVRWSKSRAELDAGFRIDYAAHRASCRRCQGLDPLPCTFGEW